MPELPEVETVVRDLRRKIMGRKILDVQTDWPRHFSRSPGGFLRVKRGIRGRKIESVSRKGKRIIFHLSGGKLMIVHLKMTGNFLLGEAGENNKFVHIWFFLDNGILFFSDIRKFGRILYGTSHELERLDDVKNVGPDPLELGYKEFRERFAKRRGIIKSALLDQSIVSGVGNIYADEILHKSKIHPRKLVENLTDADFKKLWNNSRIILEKSIATGGTSMRDFRNTEGKLGGYLSFCRVYGRKGEACLYRCGSKIERLKIGARSAHFCPKCQSR